MLNILASLFILISCFLKVPSAVYPPAQLTTGTDVSIWYTTFDRQQSKKILRADLIDRGYIPVQIAVQNPTEHSFILSPDQISLPSSSGSSVAMSITKRAIPRAIGYKVASFLFLPFMVPSTIDGIKTYAKHRSLKKTFNAHSIKKEVIPPYTTIYRIIFVPSNVYQNEFTVSIENKKNGEIKTFSS